MINEERIKVTLLIDEISDLEDEIIKLKNKRLNCIRTKLDDYNLLKLEELLSKKYILAGGLIAKLPW